MAELGFPWVIFPKIIHKFRTLYNLHSQKYPWMSRVRTIHGTYLKKSICNKHELRSGCKIIYKAIFWITDITFQSKYQIIMLNYLIDHISDKLLHLCFFYCIRVSQ